MLVRILRRAKMDMIHARDFYDEQQMGLGSYFIDSLTAEIDALKWFAGIHPVYRGFYKLVARRFPYSVYYKVFEDVVKVYAVLDNRRSPLRNDRRLGV